MKNNFNAYSNITNPSGGSGSGGGGTFISDIPVNLNGGKTFGKYITGQTTPAIGLTVEQILNDIANEYIAPALSFNSPFIRVYEVGEPLDSGMQPINYTISNFANVVAPSPPNFGTTSQNITGAVFPITFDTLAADTLFIGIQPNTTKNTPSSFSIGLYATNTQGNSFGQSKNISFQQRVFWGQSSNPTLTAANILALQNSQLKASFNGTYSFGSGGYKWFAYPVTNGLATSFTDTSNNFPVAMQAPIIVSITNLYGVTQNYYAHRTLNILGGSINISIS